MRPLPGIAGFVALGLTSACASLPTQTGYRVDAPLVDSIKPGIDNKQSVELTLGRPTFEGAFTTYDWYYVARVSRHVAFNNPKATAQMVLHIKFDAADNVVAVEQTGLEQIARISPSGDKTPTLGSKRTLLQEIFGNIGAVGQGANPGGNPDNTGE